MSKRKNAGKGFGMMFHGAFSEKSDAKKKERQVHGFIQPRNIEGKRRYIVMSERKNPIKRRKNKEYGGVKLTREQKARLAAGRASGAPVPYAVVFRHEGQIHTWERYAHTAAQATKSAREALAREYPAGSYQLISVKPVSANPTELMVMGANPENPREITVPRGSTITIRMNPSAEGIREDFTGMEVDRETVRSEPHMPAGDYAQLGELLALYVKPARGGQVQEITFDRPRPKVVSDESARQIWFAGGDQDLSDSLSAFGAHDRGGAGLLELGEARRIDYKQRKQHVPHPESDEWRHEFGEETGVRPIVLFDQAHKRILLEGGDYEIRREGIVN